ncbi:MAG: hypothetical protein LBG89_02075, partial [Rickettsiales bacterium]|jgi:hypothetical protein|nr:hypothetical protein [Rickettsiales bacterium]
MSSMKTFLIIAAVVVVAIGIGYISGGKNPGLYQKMERIEDKAEDYAKDKAGRIFGREKAKKGDKSAADNVEVIEEDEIILIQE